MNNVGEKFLPIGTVVMLKGGSKRVMITGFCSMPADDSETMFDYSGCMYPEGFLSSDQTALFNHEQIETVYHMGLVDQEEKDFKIKLNQLLYANSNVAESSPQAVREQTGVVPEVPVAPVVTQVEPVTQQTPVVEQPVPPIGPGLPGYVAPQIPTEPVVQVTQEQPVVTNGFQFDAQGNVIAAPQAPVVSEQPSPQTLTNIQFDENGTVISA